MVVRIHIRVITWITPAIAPEMPPPSARLPAFCMIWLKVIVASAALGAAAAAAAVAPAATSALASTRVHEKSSVAHSTVGAARRRGCQRRLGRTSVHVSRAARSRGDSDFLAFSSPPPIPPPTLSASDSASEEGWRPLHAGSSS